MPNYSSRGEFTGLTTWDFGVPTAGPYSIQGPITLPKISEGDASGSQMVVTVSVNGGAPIYTGLPGADGFKTSATMAASDIFNVTFTSSAVIDQRLNAIKSTITVTEL